MTFQEIQQYIYRRTGHPDTPVSEVSTRIKQFINERHREILTAEGMRELRQYTFTFASNTSDTQYALPQVLTRIHNIYEQTNDIPLSALSMTDYRRLEPDPSAFQGTPDAYVELGRFAVAKQPANASELFLVSSAAGDTAVIPYLEVVQANSFSRDITATTLNGTTAVSANTAITDITQVVDFYLSAAPAGDVTLREDAGDTTGIDLAVIKAGDNRPRYHKIALSPRPSSAVTYFVDGEVEIRDMANNTDEPLLPTDFHWVLAEAALHDEYIKKEKAQEATRALEKHLNGMKALKAYLTNPPDFLPVQGAERFRGVSRLGPFYPADRILG